MMHSTAARRVALMGILAALALTLSALEGWLPPLPFLPPGAKAGFSHIIVMFAAQTLGGPYALVLAVIKALFALLTRGGVAGAMSLFGGLGATLVMWLCVRRHASLILTGMLGAIAHNSLQLVVAMVLTETPLLVGYLPALLLFALCAGTVTGVLLKLLYPALDNLVRLEFLKKRG